MFLPGTELSKTRSSSVGLRGEGLVRKAALAARPESSRLMAEGRARATKLSCRWVGDTARGTAIFEVRTVPERTQAVFVGTLCRTVR